jgi:hypothetical protein
MSGRGWVTLDLENRATSFRVRGTVDSVKAKVLAAEIEYVSLFLR